MSRTTEDPVLTRDNLQTDIHYIFFIGSLAHSERRPLIQFRNHFSQTVGLLGRVISPSQGCYINTGQHKHRINAYTHTPNIHASSGIRAHDPSVRASEDSSWLRLRGCCDQYPLYYTYLSNKTVHFSTEPTISSFFKYLKRNNLLLNIKN
jgi:hypothetical protein